jgi:hypothetical protein
MLKAKNQKPKTFMYGIEITKPWSKEMYAHNERTAEHLKDQILTAFQKTYISGTIQELKLRDIAHVICGCRFGEGFSIDDIKEETIKEIVNMPLYLLHENMYYMHHKDYVKTQAMGLIGFASDPHLVPYWEVK